MARVSFTVRSTGAASGSFLRYDDASASPGLFPARADYDSALRADGIQLAPAQVGASSFSGRAVSYGKIDLEWNVPLVTPSGSVGPVGVIIVYSDLGTPQTMASGTVLLDTSSATTYTHSGLTEGKWAYYSMFVHYSTSPLVDDYYEKVAELEILVPKDYGSTLRMWNNLPAAVKVQDVHLGDFDYSPEIGITHGDAVGPLFKYLSIVGFDIDRIRTLIDYLMVSDDPQLANSETLAALANMLGINLQVSDLGDNRIRAILDDIGTYRRSKGTTSAISLFTNAVTGSAFSVNTTTKKFTVYSQRSNYITNPKTGSGITTWRAALGSEVATPLAFTSTAASAGAADVTLSGTTWTRTTAVHGITGALIKLSSPVPVLYGDFVMFSVHSTTPAKLVWARLVNGAGATVGFGNRIINVGGVYYIEIDVTNASLTSTSTYTNCTIEYLVDLTNGSYVGENYLAERNFLGDYFDGSTVRGGWLVGTPSISDYRWSGSANNSVSIYSEDYQRSTKAIQTLISETLPITEAAKYSILSYNAIPGF